MKYIVTDPCYLLHINANEDENQAVWEKFCELWFADKFEDAEQLLKDYLNLDFLKISDTGYGDWCNSIHNEYGKNKILKHDFFADAGLVCVANCTAEIEENNISGAVFETEKLVDVCFDDYDRAWTVVKIYTAEGRIYSQLEDEDNYDDDYYHDDEDYEDEE